MNKWLALNEWFESFGVKAYQEQTVSEKAVLPYIAYELAFGDIDNSPLSLTFSYFERSTNWEGCYQKVEQISADIGRWGKRLVVDGGFLVIQRGQPFAQPLDDMDGDKDIRRMVFNIDVFFFTSN
jgi:hypothetical protein